jgi:(p)ppGpp synthase/HD superfamily hydrolase
VSWEPGQRFSEALAFAVEAHRTQRRKGSETPYIAHLMSVSALVIEDGGSEDEAIAALLHDAAEDQGGEQMLEEIAQRFGSEVRRIVAACSDTFEMPKPEWRRRKEDYIAAVAGKQRDEVRVSLADKLHNARSILLDLRALGDHLWPRFSADRESVIWNYRALATEFTKLKAGPMADELERVVADIEALVAA